MEIVPTAHAGKRMRERRVSDDEVQETLANYDTETPAKNGLRHRYKLIGNRRIRVTFDFLEPETYSVVTVTVDEVERDAP